MTFLGLAFPLDGAPPAAKLYFAPGGGNPQLPPEMPEALRAAMDRAVRARRAEAWRLHDVSVARNGNGDVTGRLLWALCSGARTDDGHWPEYVRGLLSGLGHLAFAEPLLRLNARLREILRAELAPLCQIGGFLAPDGSFFRLKANFDADASRSPGRVEYDRDRALAATRYLLEECGADASGTARLLSRLDAVMQGACHFHSWGLHAGEDRLEALKIYVRDERPADRAFPVILRGFFPGAGASVPRPPRSDTVLLPFGWSYHGFYAEIASASFRTLKFYFRAPPRTVKGTP